MQTFQKLIVLNLIATAALVADETCCPEIIEDCCECNVCPPTCEITPKAGPCVKNSTDLYLTADFIYWTAREENLEFAMTRGTQSAVGAPATAPKGKVYQPNSNWRPGFKVGVGYDLCFDGWDLYAEYTWFRSTTHRSTSNSLNSSLQLNDSYWLISNADLTFSSGTDSAVPIYILPGSSATEKWHLSFNVIDLELGRNFYISRRVMFRPYFGLKGTWQTQKLDVNFQGILDAVPSFSVTSSMTNKIRDWGIGILAGVDGAWHLTRNFSFLGKLALSCLWQRFKIERVDNEFIPALNANISFLNVSSKLDKLTPVIEWMLGLRWESWFSCDTYHISFDVGWEMQNWFSQNKFVRVSGSPKCDGDLTLQGLTLRARFDF